MTLVKFKPGFSLRDSMIPSSFSKALDAMMEEAFIKPSINFSPAMDITEDEQGYHFALTLAGMKKEDIKIDIKNDVLTISGERQFVKKDTHKVHTIESNYGAFTRSITLPENVKTEAITAEFTNGVLHVVVPKGEVAKPKAIEIK